MNLNLILPMPKRHIHGCLLMLSLLLSSPLLLAEPASEVAWTPTLLKMVKAGNSAAGKELAKNCIACHGQNGISNNPTIPSLAGQLATYTYKQLTDYQQGKRTGMMMTPIVTNLTRIDIIDLAAWFATLTTANRSNQSDKLRLTHAQNLVFKGDGKRTIPPCFVCHGNHGQGEKMDIPALAGQQSEYLRKTLMEYKAGERKNDIYSRMRLIANQLSEQEIEELSRYYQQLQ